MKRVIKKYTKKKKIMQFGGALTSKNIETQLELVNKILGDENGNHIVRMLRYNGLNSEHMERYLLTTNIKEIQYRLFCWIKNNIDNVVVKVPENTLFCRTLTRYDVRQINVMQRDLSSTVKNGMFFNASPLCNINVNVKLPIDAVIFIRTKKPLYLLNLIPFCHLFLMQWKYRGADGITNNSLEWATNYACKQLGLNGVIQHDNVENVYLNNIDAQKNEYFTTNDEKQKIMGKVYGYYCYEEVNAMTNQVFYGKDTHYDSDFFWFPEFLLFQNDEDLYDITNVDPQFDIHKLNINDLTDYNKDFDILNSNSKFEKSVDDVFDETNKQRVLNKLKKYYSGLHIYSLQIYNNVDFYPWFKTQQLNMSDWEFYKQNKMLNFETISNNLKSINSVYQRGSQSDYSKMEIRGLIGPYDNINGDTELLTKFNTTICKEECSINSMKTCEESLFDFMKVKGDATNNFYTDVDCDNWVKSVSLHLIDTFIYNPNPTLIGPLISKINELIKSKLIKYTKKHGKFIPIVHDQDDIDILNEDLYKLSEILHGITKDNKFENVDEIQVKLMESKNAMLDFIQQPKDINKFKTIAPLFYNIYLKGGSAFRILFDDQKRRDARLNLINLDKTLGAKSDYDLNAVINPYFKESDFFAVQVALNTSLTQFFEWIYAHTYTHWQHNTKWSTKMYNSLHNNIAEKDLIIDVYNNKYTSTQKVIEGESTKRNELPNGKGESYLFYSFGDKVFVKTNDLSTEFGLHRLMLQMIPRDIIHVESGTHLFEDVTVAVELIDVSVINYGGTERFHKWYDSQTLFAENMKSIFYDTHSPDLIMQTYNFKSSIHDLQVTIEDNIRENNTAKLKKRQKRKAFLSEMYYIYVKHEINTRDESDYDALGLLNFNGLKEDGAFYYNPKIAIKFINDLYAFPEFLRNINFNYNSRIVLYFDLFLRYIIPNKISYLHVPGDFTIHFSLYQLFINNLNELFKVDAHNPGIQIEPDRVKHSKIYYVNVLFQLIDFFYNPDFTFFIQKGLFEIYSKIFFCLYTTQSIKGIPADSMHVIEDNTSINHTSFKIWWRDIETNIIKNVLFTKETILNKQNQQLELLRTLINGNVKFKIILSPKTKNFLEYVVNKLESGSINDGFDYKQHIPLFEMSPFTICFSNDEEENKFNKLMSEAVDIPVYNENEQYYLYTFLSNLTSDVNVLNNDIGCNLDVNGPEMCAHSNLNLTNMVVNLGAYKTQKSKCEGLKNITDFINSLEGRINKNLKGWMTEILFFIPDDLKSLIYLENNYYSDVMLFNEIENITNLSKKHTFINYYSNTFENVVVGEDSHKMEVEELP
jgi:hypothetical protein